MARRDFCVAFANCWINFGRYSTFESLSGNLTWWSTFVQDTASQMLDLKIMVLFKIINPPLICIHVFMFCQYWHILYISCLVIHASIVFKIICCMLVMGSSTFSMSVMVSLILLLMQTLHIGEGAGWCWCSQGRANEYSEISGEKGDRIYASSKT